MDASYGTGAAGWRRRLFEPVDGASLAVFRIGFGLTMFVDVVRYWSAGWIGRYYVEPDFHFKYYGFAWVEPWPGDGMYWHFAALGVLSICIAAGLFYRLAAALFAVGFTYVFLLDQTHYLNHFYFVILLAVLAAVVPAHRTLSLDAARSTNAHADTVPRWAVWSLRAQMEVMLIYAGVVKVNADWLRGEPLTMWFARRANMPVLGDWLSEPWVGMAGSYGSILLHLVGAPLLLWKRTRLPVFLLYVAFHVSNHTIFSIGIFPWLTIIGTLVFFDPDWPRQLATRLGIDDSASAGPQSATSAPASAAHRRLVEAFLIAWFAVQVLLPLRHVLYPGNVSWTEEGHRFSWQMKLRDKQGTARLRIVDPSASSSWPVNPGAYLTSRQVRKMSCRPDMLLQFAHHVATVWRLEHDVAEPRVYADVFCSLNGRPRARLIDPHRDLAAIERDLAPADWILPLTEPLP